MSSGKICAMGDWRWWYEALTRACLLLFFGGLLIFGIVMDIKHPDEPKPEPTPVQCYDDCDYLMPEDDRQWP